MAIEVSDTYSAYLVDKYSALPQVTVVHGSVLDESVLANLDGGVDCIVILFSTFMEFSKEEQLRVFQRCSRWLALGGHLVIDVSNPGDRGKVVLSFSESISYELFQGHFLHVYLPSPSEMAAYASASGLAMVASEEWLLQVGKVFRQLYVLEKAA
ncbi:hypothetical protein AC1031_006111 [Aphanomyces cochlioides]|nr:hypothetical protein AC1031_006111 [Aphanomyces cochlioides]